MLTDITKEVKDVKKHEVLNALDRISEMSEEEIKMNADFIKKITNLAYALIKQK